jgi:uncharacterized protein YqgC (DUF456 family)
VAGESEVRVSAAGEVVVGLLMAVGLVGVVVPVLPGLALIGAVAVFWAFAEGTATAWTVAVVMLVVLAAGTYLKYRLPGRELQAQQVPTLTWTLVALGGIAGFFVIPVVGAFAGVVVGGYAGERIRFGKHAPAWASTKRLVASIGKGIAVELAAGLLAILIWVFAVLAL